MGRRVLWELDRTVVVEEETGSGGTRWKLFQLGNVDTVRLLQTRRNSKSFPKKLSMLNEAGNGKWARMKIESRWYGN